MNWKEFKQRINSLFFGGYEDKIEELEFLINSLATSLKACETNYKNKIDSSGIIIVSLTKQLAETQDLIDQGWDNPHGFKIYTGGDFKTIITDSYKTLNIPPNTFITPNDRRIKAEVSKHGLRKESVLATSKAVLKHLKSRIKYVYDHQNSFSPDKIEYFQTASMTWQLRRGDCEDMAILFQTFMHVCDYKKECVVCVDKKSQVVWFNGEVIGHAWNKVFLNNEWVDIDVNAAIFDKESEVIYPSIENVSYFFNYYGNYRV